MDAGSVEALVEVVMELSFPLGISNIPGQSRKSKLRMRKEAEKIILELDITNIEGEVNFHDTIRALMDRAMGGVRFHNDVSHKEEEVKQQIVRRATIQRRKTAVKKKKSQENPEKRGSSGKGKKSTAVMPVLSARSYTVAEDYAARRLQSTWRKYKSGKRRKLMFNE